ncbi:MAG: right-handed parallel beta-helix repeat-containing protein [Deltaproteobacteria bacterium]|nr:right-handed parallel beta-helix repeat-containing protein [Deltaproteobacteria bacterium]
MIPFRLLRHLSGAIGIVLAGAMLMPAGGNALDAQPAPRDRGAVVTRGDISYENVTITEDVTWRGTVLVRGGVVIAPQATLRIEPGTVVRFMRSVITRQSPRLVVMGRLQCNGTADKPVLLAPNFAEAARGDWGGVLLLSSEKRNLLEHCRIEGAETAIEARFSTFSAKGVTIAGAGTGLLLRDSTATLATLGVSACGTGLESHDSEIELREGTLTENRQGIVAHRSALALARVDISGSDRQGILADECRIRFNSCELAGNGVGALLTGGEGQILLSRFVRNRDVGLQLAGARIKVQRCLFADNLGDGMRVEDGRGVVWASVFSGNGGYNLASTGRETISAVQNWWGSNDEAAIAAKLLGAVVFAPWLAERPAGVP